MEINPDMNDLLAPLPEDFDLESFKEAQVQIAEDMKWAHSYLESMARESQGPFGMELVGQHVARAQVEPYLKAIRFPHTLILGPTGIGKTHMARWIAGQRHEVFEEFLAPVRPEQMPDYGIVLIDEAHRQGKPEPLFPIMEAGKLSVMAATTRPELLDPALVSRFLLRLNLELLEPEDAEVLMSLLLDNTDADVSVLARASAGNPRQAERIAETAKALGTLDPEQILSTVRINADGLDDVHLNILRNLKRLARPTGVSQLATLMFTSEQDIKEHERLLLHHGLVDLTSNGRMLTKKGLQYAQGI